MSSNVYNLLPHLTPGQPSLYLGSVSIRQPAPQSFADPLYVEYADMSTDHYQTVTNWPACHGALLPQCGADVLLLQDSNRNLRCVWWDGLTGFPASAGIGGPDGNDSGPAQGQGYGAHQWTFPITLPPQGMAGGALAGDYPNPTLAQSDVTGTTSGFTANSGTAMNSASTSTGGTGATAYTFGDVVLALKQLGALAQ